MDEGDDGLTVLGSRRKRRAATFGPPSADVINIYSSLRCPSLPELAGPEFPHRLTAFIAAALRTTLKLHPGWLWPSSKASPSVTAVVGQLRASHDDSVTPRTLALTDNIDS